MNTSAMTVSGPSPSPERRLVTRFDASALSGSDFAGAGVRGGKFEASMLRGSDFSHADLTGSSFRSSYLADASFDGAGLTDAGMSALAGPRSAGVAPPDVRLRLPGLRHTVFEDCSFTGVDFTHADLRGLDLD